MGSTTPLEFLKRPELPPALKSQPTFHVHQFLNTPEKESTMICFVVMTENPQDQVSRLSNTMIQEARETLSPAEFRKIFPLVADNIFADSKPKTTDKPTKRPSEKIVKKKKFSIFNLPSNASELAKEDPYYWVTATAATGLVSRVTE